jgi:hypothetical protein
MSDKATKTTKADLLKMLAEAVRNTTGATPIEPIRDVRPELKSKTESQPKRTAKAKSVRTSSSRKQGPRKRSRPTRSSARN